MGGGIELTNVTFEENRASRRRAGSAERAVIEVSRGESLATSGLRVELRNVRVSDGTSQLHRAKETIGPIAIAPDIVDRVEAMSVDDLLRPASADGEDALDEMRANAADALAETVREVLGTISERSAFSVSIFVLVILAAVLGIVFRGAHVMTAFGISFVPLLFVLLMIVTGKQMAQNAATHLLGLLTIWSGIVVVAGLDVWTMSKVLRR